MLSLIITLFSIATVILCSPAREDNEKRQRELVEIGQQFNITVDASRISAQQAQILFKMRSYCSCVCCQETIPDSGIMVACDRSTPVQLPRDFICPQTYCSQSQRICSDWDQAKCDRACFCQRCNDTQLATNDYRCRGRRAHLLPGPACNCSAIQYPAPCRPESQELQTTWLAVSLLSRRRNIVNCLFGCFCNLCNVDEISVVIPSVHAICAGRTIPEQGCDCPPCPTLDNAVRARQQFNALSISHAAGRK